MLELFTRIQKETNKHGALHLGEYRSIASKRRLCFILPRQSLILQSVAHQRRPRENNEHGGTSNTEFDTS